MADDIQKKLESEIEAFKSVRKGKNIAYSRSTPDLTSNFAEYQKAVQTRQQLDGQLKENEIVKGELDLLQPDGTVFMSVGPVLIKTELIEAKQNVAKRMDYIGREIKRVDELLLSLDKKQDGHRETLQKLQRQFEQSQVKAAMKA